MSHGDYWKKGQNKLTKSKMFFKLNEALKYQKAHGGRLYYVDDETTS